MAKPLQKGGVFSNLDLAEIAPHVRKETETAERAVAIIDDAKDEARKAGGGDFFDVYMAHEKQKSHQITTDWQKKSEREVGNLGALKPLRLIAADANSPFGFTWVLTERDAAAVNEWRFCPHCLQAQKTRTNSQCEWARPQVQDTKGCGYNRLAEQFFDQHGATKGMKDLGN